MISIRQLTKKFDARGIAGLHALSLELGKGKILALMGPNGSGKSTLLNIISGSIKADSGEVKISGLCLLVNDKKDAENINVLKLLIQSVNLSIDEEKKIQLARDLADIFEFTFQLRQNFQELSQGQRQKVLLCTELINRPETILLDEPFNHLDPFSRREILKGLFQYIKQQGLSVIWVTHDRAEAFHFADDIALLNFGKLEQVGAPEEVMLNPANFFVAQFLGYQNFILCKRLGTDMWSTPWGPWQNEKFFTGDEALLVIPPYAWRQDKGEFEVTLESLKPHELQWELEFIWKEQKFLAHFPLSEKTNLNTKKLSLRPEMKDCFLINL
jgi:ABC-type Fe3+/spermidine/putrescine transport system ATPase subunit